MRIVVTGNRATHEWPESCVRTLRRMGHDVRLVYHSTPSEEELARFVAGAEREMLPVLLSSLEGRKALMEYVLHRECTEFRPDLLLLAGIYHTWTGEALADLRSSLPDTRVVLWAGDDPYRTGAPDIFARAPYYDEVWFANFRFAERAASAFARVGYLPFGCDPERDAPPPRTDTDMGANALAPYACDIGFLGTLKDGREAFLDRLARERWDLKVWGEGWNDARAARYPALAAAWQPEPIQGAAKRRLYPANEVVLNLHHTGFANMKLYEVASCGAFQISNQREEAAATRHVLPFCDDVVCYETWDELIELLEFWLPRPEERARHARELRRTMHAEHTWAHRLETLLHLPANAAASPLA